MSGAGLALALIDALDDDAVDSRRLSDAEMDWIARRTADYVLAELAGRASTFRPLVDAATVAEHLGVSRKHVYTHAAELGGRRVGGGALRFDLAVARRDSAPPTPPPSANGPPKGRPRWRATRPAVELLPIRGDR